MLKHCADFVCLGAKGAIADICWRGSDCFQGLYLPCVSSCRENRHGSVSRHGRDRVCRNQVVSCWSSSTTLPPVVLGCKQGGPDRLRLSFCFAEARAGICAGARALARAGPEDVGEPDVRHNRDGTDDTAGIRRDPH